MHVFVLVKENARRNSESITYANKICTTFFAHGRELIASREAICVDTIQRR